MGAFLEKPKTEKHTTTDSKGDIKYAVASMQGWRVEMEDAHTAITSVSKDLKDWSFFAVFDGHAGSAAAHECSLQLLDHTLKSISGSTVSNCDVIKDKNAVVKAIESGFISFDGILSNGSNGSDDRSGTTATSVFVTPLYYIFVNCGDSRGILVSENQVKFATTDHKPTLERERSRIEKAGGSVIFDRVNGTLAVSRALGDFDYKGADNIKPADQIVSAVPDVTFVDRNFTSTNDNFVLLACDGIWDVMSNDDVKEFVMYKLQLTHDLVSICCDLIDTCMHKGSRDNMSVILVTLPGVPKIDESKVKSDTELTDQIVMETNNYLSTQNLLEEFSINSLMAHVESTIPSVNLLPGGFDSKKQLIIDLHSKRDGVEPTYTFTHDAN